MPRRWIDDSGAWHRTQATRGAHANDTAKGRRIPKRPAHVGAVCDRQHPARECDGCAPAAAAACLRQVVRIERRAEHGIERLRPGAKLRRVGLSNSDRARAFQLRDERRIGIRHVVAEHRRSERRPDPGGRLQIFMRDRQAMQRSDRVTARHALVGASGFFHRLLCDERDDRVDSRIDGVDARQVRGDDVARRQRARAQLTRELSGRLLPDIQGLP